MARLFYSLRDNSDEYSTIILPIGEPADITTVGDADDGLDALATTIAAVSLANLAKQSMTIQEEEPANSNPGNALAQRELGLRIFYQGDSSGKRYHFTIAAPDLASLTFVAGSDLVDITVAPMAALVTDIENWVKPAYGAGTEAVTVLRALVVGRPS